MKVKRVALTSLAAAVFTLLGSQALALGLGRLNVQSSLGEALRAEIDITSLPPEEAATLQIRIATPETYRAAGVEYHPALSSARVVLARRADGRPFLRVTSDRVVTEPFVDVILEMNWATGRLVREYTLLLDPPRTGTATAAAPTAPIVAAPPAAPVSAAPPAAISPVAPAVATPSPVAPPAPAAEPAPAPVAASAPSPAAAAPAAPSAAPAPRTAARPAPPSRREAAAPVPAPSAPKTSDVRVRSGDTLTGIAQRVQAPGVSLDQLLVSMFRTNPQAFSGDNMNRLRAGAILKVPEASEAQSVSPSEARSVIVAQSSDFNAYRRRLASGVASAPDSGPSRQAGGKVQASVDDRKQAAAPTPDKLKLSQGSMKASAPEAKVSRETATKDASSRVAELSRNLEDLKKIQGSAAVAAGPAAKPPAAAAASAPITLPVPGPTVTAKAPTPAPTPTPPAVAPAPVTPPKPPVVAAAPTPAPVTPTPAPTPPAPAPVAAASAPSTVASAAKPTTAPTPPVMASAPATVTAPPVAAAKPASAPSVALSPKPPVKVPEPVEEPGLLAKIMESPFMLPFGAVLAVALAGFGIYRVRARGRKTAGETSFMESRLQPDSFFGASGGQRVDTAEGAGGASTAGAGSSMNYSLSQLDAIGDVDPVAEADVYLAYGRDLQAEEILKEAMRTDPGRLAVRTKLLEVYAKRRDVKGFEMLANQLFTLTRGEGADWAKAQELGRSLDPENPLYGTGRSDAIQDDDQFVEPLGASTMPHSAMPSASSFGTNSDLLDDSPPGVTVSDVDIDLSFDADLDETPTPGRDRHAPLDATMPYTPANMAAMGAVGVASAAGAASSLADDVIDVEVTERKGGGIDIPIDDKEAMDFDLSDLSLDLDPPAAAPASAKAVRASENVTAEARHSGFVDLSGLPDDPDSRFNDDGDPLERKLDLADEFRQIGDLEGARDLLSEVISGADGALKQKAQTMLDSLG